MFQSEGSELCLSTEGRGFYSSHIYLAALSSLVWWSQPRVVPGYWLQYLLGNTNNAMSQSMKLSVLIKKIYFLSIRLFWICK